MMLRDWLSLSSEILSLPEITIRVSGEMSVRQIFQTFTKPHPRYKIIQNKRWGVALLGLPGAFQQYLTGKDKQAVRTNRRRADAAGFHFAPCEGRDYLDDILAINTSSEVRQGSPMAAGYKVPAYLQEWIESKPVIWGVLNREGRLRAYAQTLKCGEVFIFSRLLGHKEDLDHGIMYLLVSEVIREMIETKTEGGKPLWGMYDTFFGAAPGLRYFKERLGFKPYKVKWVWEGQN